MAAALAPEPDLAPLAAVLRDWDHRDDPGAVAPTVFQATWREFARLAFEDELGTATTARMLESWYFWHERLARLCADPDGAWFDDVATPARETRDELFRRAARAAAADLAARLGEDPAGWRWCRLHTVTFASPIVPGAFAAALLGGGTRPMEGSGETLNRAIYRYERPYETVTIASLRFVADLADPEKVMAVLPGGASSRQFGPHLDDQLDAWASGEPRYWWFSDAAIAREARHVLHLVPTGPVPAPGRAGPADQAASAKAP
jgi:penicillin amidase